MGAKIVVVGAGPVGTLAAIYAARRGHSVYVYELREDLLVETTSLGFTRSINLAVSERGLAALRNTKIKPAIDEHIISQAGIPMRGRMVHNASKTQIGQDYDPVNGACIHAVNRRTLNYILLKTLSVQPNVRLFFNHKLVRVDYAAQKAWFEAHDPNDNSKTIEISEVSFDLLIGADGAHSKARFNMTGPARMDYSHQYIDALWSEFYMAPCRDGDDPTHAPWRMSKNHLHIWPGKDRMFIAIPNPDGSFTCTLFMPADQYIPLEADPQTTVPPFFDEWFPGVTDYIPPADLVASFCQSPHLPLISIKCSPHHVGSSGVIIGDAAHAMVPFFGQGMNAGLEDVSVLFETLDKYNIKDASQRALALAEYSALRVPDAHAINDMALENYIEMRASVLSPVYKLRKRLEELMSRLVPSLGWKTRYSRVSFSTERYSLAVQKSVRQGRVLEAVLTGACLGIGLSVAAVVYRRRF